MIESALPAANRPARLGGDPVTRQTRAYVLALAAVLCWSTVASAFKLTLRHTDPLAMLLWSSLASTLFLFAVRFARGIGRTRPSLAEGWKLSAVNGFLNPFLYYAVLFRAYDVLPAQEAQPLNYTWPIMVVLLSAPMLGQKIRPLGLVAILVSFAGVLIISTRGDVLGLRFTNGPGAALAVGSSVIWALYWIRNMKDRREPVTKLAMNFLFGTIYIALLHAGLGRWPDAGGGMALAGCAYIGLFEMGFAFILWLNAMSLSETSAKVSNLVFLSPFISLLFIRLIVGETIFPSSILGLTVIVLGIGIQKRCDG
ncbi:MAG: DMT family transporter [Candidatus Eisenbacteria bacterium]